MNETKMGTDSSARRRVQDIGFFVVVAALVIMGLMNPSTLYVSLFIAFIGTVGYLKRRRSQT